MITSASLYFKTALKGPWRDGERPLTLEDTDARNFELYLNWLYNSVIDLAYSSRAESPDDINTLTYLKSECMRLVELFVLGDMIMDRRFCNAVLDAIGQFTGAGAFILHKDIISLVWSKTTPDSRLRMVLIDEFIFAPTRYPKLQWYRHLKANNNLLYRGSME